VSELGSVTTEVRPRAVETLVEELQDTIDEMAPERSGASFAEIARALLVHAHTLAAQHGFARELLEVHENLLEETETE